MNDVCTGCMCALGAVNTSFVWTFLCFIIMFNVFTCSFMLHVYVYVTECISPQGTVLSPILFTLYSNDCTGTDTTPIIKYSDNSAVKDLSSSDSVYFAAVERFSNWCRHNSFDLNVKKTKGMLIHFRKAPSCLSRSVY